MSDATLAGISRKGVSTAGAIASLLFATWAGLSLLPLLGSGIDASTETLTANVDKLIHELESQAGFGSDFGRDAAADSVALRRAASVFEAGSADLPSQMLMLSDKGKRFQRAAAWMKLVPLTLQAAQSAPSTDNRAARIVESRSYFALALGELKQLRSQLSEASRKPAESERNARRWQLALSTLFGLLAAIGFVMAGARPEAKAEPLEEDRLSPFDAPAEPPSPEAQALRADHDLLTTVVRHIPTPLALFDTSGRIVRMNRALEQISEYPAVELRARPYWETVLEGGEAERARKDFESLESGDLREVIDEIWKTASGRKKHLRWNRFRVRVGDRVSYLVGTVDSQPWTGLPAGDGAAQAAMRPDPAMSGTVQALLSQLTLINGYADLAMNVLPATEGVWSDLDEIRRSGARAEALACRALGMASPRAGAAETVELLSWLPTIEERLTVMLPVDWRFSIRGGSASASVSADPEQLANMALAMALHLADTPGMGREIAASVDLVQRDDHLATALSFEKVTDATMKAPLAYKPWTESPSPDAQWADLEFVARAARRMGAALEMGQLASGSAGSLRLVFGRRNRAERTKAASAAAELSHP